MLPRNLQSQSGASPEPSDSNVLAYARKKRSTALPAHRPPRPPLAGEEEEGGGRGGHGGCLTAASITTFTLVAVIDAIQPLWSPLSVFAALSITTHDRCFNRAKDRLSSANILMYANVHLFFETLDLIFNGTCQHQPIRKCTPELTFLLTGLCRSIIALARHSPGVCLCLRERACMCVPVPPLVHVLSSPGHPTDPYDFFVAIVPSWQTGF